MVCGDAHSRKGGSPGCTSLASELLQAKQHTLHPWGWFCVAVSIWHVINQCSKFS